MNVRIIGSLCLLLCSSWLYGCGLDHHQTNAFNGSSNDPILETGRDSTENRDRDEEIEGNSGSFEEKNPNDSCENCDPSTPRSSKKRIYNTNYCQVDDDGNILSSDSIEVTDGYRIVGKGGGCVRRPIREVWAVILNHQNMKTEEISEYVVSPRQDLIDLGKKIFFVFDIESRVKALGGLKTITWLTRWYHAVPRGTVENPRKISVNFQKIEGSSYLEHAREGYVLDHVTPEITGFAMIQEMRVFRVDAERVHRNITEILHKLRTYAPDWSALP